MVSIDNYEEFLLLQADGELNADGEAALEAFLQAHPELRAEQELYAKVKLSPDTEMVFADKEGLLRDEPKGRVVSFGNWRQYSAAAGILALIALGFMKWNAGDEQPTIVRADTSKQQITVQPDKAPEQKTEEPQLAKETLESNEATLPRVKQRSTQQVRNVTVANHAATERKETMPLPERMETVNEPKPLVANIRKEMKTTVALPAIPETEEAEVKEDALAWLPISEEKKEGLSEIKNAIDRRFEKVKEAGETIKNTDLAVKLGKKELFTIRF